MNVKIPSLPVALFAVAILAGMSAARSAETPTLKEAFKEHFLVGTAINRSIATGAPVQSRFGSRTLDQVQRDVALVKKQFNLIVAENDMKWLLIHPRPGADGYNFEPADAFVEFGLRNDMYLAGHTLVWHSQTPDWVFAGTNPPPASAEAAAEGPRPGGFRRGYTGPRASREELIERMREHIHTVVGRYKGKIKVWDVVNEAIADGGTNVLRNSLWLQIIGPDYIPLAFKFAREADPEAILRYNDYGLENAEKRRKLITLIKSLLDDGVPVHAIGSQAHVNVSINFETMDQALTEMRTLGLPIHITELDVNSAQAGQRSISADVGSNDATLQGGVVDDAERKLAAAYAGIFRAFMMHHDAVTMVTFWGAHDAVSWRRQGRPLLFDGEHQPKPAFDAVLRLASDPHGNP
jgi:endo-1,4-beta-xylanase